MGCGSQILHMILIIFIPILFLHPELLMAGAPLYPADNSDADGLREQYWTGDSVESPIKKVSGEDDNEEMKALILEKFRVLLGMKSFNLGSPTNGDVEHGLSSPSPAPTVEDEAPVVPIHVHFHPPSLRGRPIHPPHKVRRRNGDKDRVRRIVIVIVVSAGATLVISALGFILLFRKFGRCQLRRTSVSGSTDGRSRGRLKYVIPPNSTSKVSFDLSPEHFYLDSLGPVSEPEAASLKHTSDNVTISTNEYPSSSPMDEVGDTCEDLIKSKSDNVSSSAEEIISVHVEQNKCELDVGNCSSTDEIIHPESLSSDDESFHSFCGSRSSNVRLSSASERSLSEPSEVFSRLSFSEISSPLNQGFTEATLSSSMESPVAPVTPDLTPPLYSNLHSSPPNSPTNPKQRIPSLCSSNSQQNFPPPPPPPPPPANVSLLHFCAPQSLSAPTRTVSRSKISKVSSPQDSDSSSQSKQTPSNDLPSSILHKPPQVSPTPLGGCGSIPPPPSPPLPPPLQPPFLKGHKNSHQPPPPPPCQLTRFTPVGKDGAPLPKLKPLHWDKVRATADRSMVWDKLRSSSFEFDEEMIESLFGYNLQSSIKNDEAKNKSLSPSKHVLEPKRLQNLTILSKALNATVEQVCDALLQGDGLCLQQLEALVKMVPTKEEEAKLSNYQGNINELGSAEKFVKVMLNIPFAFPRIEAMLYRETFEDEVVDLRKSFAMLEEACKELRSSRLFLKLLEAVLKTGNRMNVGTIRGGARAFKLDALLKLADVKGTDGKTTLLHFVVQEMIRSEGIRESEIIIKKTNQKLKNKATEEREEEYRRMGLDLVSGLSTELCNVKKTATIDLDVLASSVSNLSDGMVKLQHLVLKDLSINDQNGKFVLSMRYFLNYAEKCIKELQEDENRVLLQVRDITEYFHGDVSKEEANPLRIFVIVRDFLGMLDQVCNEVRSLKTQSIQNPVAPFR